MLGVHSISVPAAHFALSPRTATCANLIFSPQCTTVMTVAPTRRMDHRILVSCRCIDKPDLLRLNMSQAANRSTSPKAAGYRVK